MPPSLRSSTDTVSTCMLRYIGGWQRAYSVCSCMANESDRSLWLWIADHQPHTTQMRGKHNYSTCFTIFGAVI